MLNFALNTLTKSIQNMKVLIIVSNIFLYIVGFRVIFPTLYIFILTHSIYSKLFLSQLYIPTVITTRSSHKTSISRCPLALPRVWVAQVVLGSGQGTHSCFHVSRICQAPLQGFAEPAPLSGPRAREWCASTQAAQARLRKAPPFHSSKSGPPQIHGVSSSPL